MEWRELLRSPVGGDHIVRLYDDDASLCDSVVEYLAPALEGSEAAIVIATPSHRTRFAEALAARLDIRFLSDEGRLCLLDAEETLARFMRGGAPDEPAFREAVGGLIASMRRRFGAVRAYGEMVDVLWQQGARAAAIALEEQWNRLAEQQPFTLFCAYRMDGLSDEAYAGPLQCVCGTHTHFIPSTDDRALEAAVLAASREVLDEPLARMMLALADRTPGATAMPRAQKALFWLHRNMPLTAGDVLARVRSRVGSAA